MEDRTILSCLVCEGTLYEKEGSLVLEELAANPRKFATHCSQCSEGYVIKHGDKSTVHEVLEDPALREDLILKRIEYHASRTWSGSDSVWLVNAYKTLKSSLEEEGLMSIIEDMEVLQLRINELSKENQGLIDQLKVTVTENKTLRGRLDELRKLLNGAGSS